MHTLESFYAPILKAKVKRVSLDFFDDREQALGIIEEYINLKYRNSDIDERLNSKLRYYRNITRSGCEGICIPSDYLNILLDYYLMKKPEIISMSFYMKTPYPAVSFSINPDMKTNLLGAVMNYTGAIEDLDTDLTGRMNEPLYTLKSNIIETGSLLIGAESNGGSYSCLHSKEGIYVSTPGSGYWEPSFTCSPEVYGTSWATPEIAAKLFIAKAYWASVNLDINAFEAKRRLLLSCDLDTRYVNKFASPGIPNINKLIRKDEDGFIEIGSEAEGISKIFRIEILRNKPKMIVNIEDGKIPWRFERSGSFFSFSGL